MNAFEASELLKMVFGLETKIEGGNFIERRQAEKKIVKLYNVFTEWMNDYAIERFNDAWHKKHGDVYDINVYDKAYENYSMAIAKKLSENGVGKLITGKHVYLDKGLDCCLIDPNTLKIILHGKIE